MSHEIEAQYRKILQEQKNKSHWPKPLPHCFSIVGHTTKNSCKIWVRTGIVGKFSLLVYARPSGTDNIYQNFDKDSYDPSIDFAKADNKQIFNFNINDTHHDTTHTEKILNLEPGKEYAYALLHYDKNEMTGKIILGDNQPTYFRTFPEKTHTYSFGFFSCNMPFHVNQASSIVFQNEVMWDRFQNTLERHYQDDLLFIIGGGDQVYSDGVSHNAINIPMKLNRYFKKKENILEPDLDTIRDWYNEIYRGYWSIDAIQRIFSRYPTYMIWDDHELFDGCGSHYFKSKPGDVKAFFPDFDYREKQYKININDARQILGQAKDAATEAYQDYQHAHNPDTPENQYDYNFDIDDESCIYFLDQRSQRDIEKTDVPNRKIHGVEQFERFSKWVEINRHKKIMFIVSPVPVFHLDAWLSDNEELLGIAGMDDDLRDSLEFPGHHEERDDILKFLFSAATEGCKVVVLSGDVHVAALFKVNDKNGNTIYQATSSAITYNIPLLTAQLFKDYGVPNKGETKSGYKFERLLYYGDSNYALIQVDKATQAITFQLYGTPITKVPTEVSGKYADAVVEASGNHQGHSIVKYPLIF